MKRLLSKPYVKPVGIVILGALLLVILSSLKQPPKEKEVVDSTPNAEVTPLALETIQVKINAHGIVQPKESTQLTAQVGGEVRYINPEFIKGGRVKQGDTLLQIDDSDYQSSLLQAEAQYASALAALETEQAQSDVAKEQWADVNNPTILALRKPQLDQAKAAVKAALAGVQKAQRDLERTKIKAPYDALIGDRQISMGSVVAPGSALGLVHNISVAQVRLPIPSKDFAFLNNAGVNAPVELINAGKHSTQRWSAQIVRNEGLVDDSSRMQFLVAELAKPYQQDNPLIFGTYVNAIIDGIKIENAARVPYHWVEEQRLITLKDESVAFVTVSVVREEGDHVIIQGEFEGSPNVVTTALQYPVEGMKVNVVNPAAKKERVGTDTDSSNSHDNDVNATNDSDVGNLAEAE